MDRKKFWPKDSEYQDESSTQLILEKFKDHLESRRILTTTKNN